LIVGMYTYQMMHSPIQCIYFIYCSRIHPCLPSFPTRRSSDLIAVMGGRRLLSTMEAISRCFSSKKEVLAAYIFDEKHRLIASIRSEEHTSELQSLRHLVCRLLLEKKKYF